MFRNRVNLPRKEQEGVVLYIASSGMDWSLFPTAEARVRYLCDCACLWERVQREERNCKYIVVFSVAVASRSGCVDVGDDCGQFHKRVHVHT